MFFVTADPHGDFRAIRRFSEANALEKEDVIFILGDAGVNYYLNERDDKPRDEIAKIRATLFCIHGNHEARPESMPRRYCLRQWHKGKVWVDDSLPNLLFARDGEVFEFAGKSVLVMGGAYSADKWARLERSWSWFPDEQPSEQAKRRAEKKLDVRGWSVDVVFTHTCPFSFEPREKYIPGVDQQLVDKTTELWLDVVERQLDYKIWYCGHWHTSKQDGRVRFLFHEIEPLIFTDEWLARDHGRARIFYTSDLHFGHKNIIALCNRPFGSVDDMNTALVRNWNGRVRPCDTVWVVGDFAYRSATPPSRFLDSLQGRKHLVLGNHDGRWLKTISPAERFESIDGLSVIDDDGRKVVLCHYPMMTWPGRDSYHVYGHIHGNKNGSYWPLLSQYRRALNACVEVNGYAPATLEELVANNEDWRGNAEENRSDALSARD